MEYLRNTVEWFGGEMLGKLRANTHKGNREAWLKIAPNTLLDLLKQEVAELEEALASGKSEDIIMEAADVANFAMFLADIACEKAVHPVNAALAKEGMLPDVKA